jgi:hypothetical protein
MAGYRTKTPEERFATELGYRYHYVYGVVHGLFRKSG